MPLDVQYLDFFDPLSDESMQPDKEDEKTDSRKKELRNHRRTTEMLEIPDKALWRKAYGVEQFLDCLRFDPPRHGYSIHVITGGNVDMICYLKYLMLHFPRMERVVVTTWCLGSAEILLLEQWYQQQRIGSIDMYTGEHCKQQYKVEWAKLERMKEAGIVRRLVCSTIHCKLILCDTGREKMVVETSSNFNMNPRIEQGCITMNDELFDFYDAYLSRLANGTEKVHN